MFVGDVCPTTKKIVTTPSRVSTSTNNPTATENSLVPMDVSQMSSNVAKSETEEQESDSYLYEQDQDGVGDELFVVKGKGKGGFKGTCFKCGMRVVLFTQTLIAQGPHSHVEKHESLFSTAHHSGEGPGPPSRPCHCDGAQRWAAGAVQPPLSRASGERRSVHERRPRAQAQRARKFARAFWWGARTASARPPVSTIQTSYHIHNLFLHLQQQ